MEQQVVNPQNQVKRTNKEAIIAHIKRRFSDLKTILENNPKLKLVIASNFGTAVQEEWENLDDFTNMIAAFYSELQELSKLYMDRIILAEAVGDVADNPPGTDYLHIWGANANNWNLAPYAKIEGEGEAFLMRRQRIGVFGIVITPIKGIEGLEEPDKTHDRVINDQLTISDRLRELDEGFVLKVPRVYLEAENIYPLAMFVDMIQYGDNFSKFQGPEWIECKLDIDEIKDEKKKAMAQSLIKKIKDIFSRKTYFSDNIEKNINYDMLDFSDESFAHYLYHPETRKLAFELVQSYITDEKPNANTKSSRELFYDLAAKYLIKYPEETSNLDMSLANIEKVLPKKEFEERLIKIESKLKNSGKIPNDYKYDNLKAQKLLKQHCEEINNKNTGNIHDPEFRMPKEGGFTGIITKLDNIKGEKSFFENKIKFTIPIEDFIKNSPAERSGLIKKGDNLVVYIPEYRMLDDVKMENGLPYVISYIRNNGLCSNEKEEIEIKIEEKIGNKFVEKPLNQSITTAKYKKAAGDSYQLDDFGVDINIKDVSPKTSPQSISSSKIIVGASTAASRTQGK